MLNQLHRRGSMRCTRSIALAAGVTIAGLGGCVEGTPLTTEVLIAVNNDDAAEDLQIVSMFKTGPGPLEWKSLPVAAVEADWQAKDAEPIWPWSPEVKWGDLFKRDKSEFDKMGKVTSEDLGGIGPVAQCRKFDGDGKRQQCRLIVAPGSTIVLDATVKAHKKADKSYKLSWLPTAPAIPKGEVGCNEIASRRTKTACVLNVTGPTRVTLNIVEE